MRRFTYLLSLIFVFTIPAVAIFLCTSNHLNLFNLTTFIIGITLIGCGWDIWATRHGKNDAVWLWQFNKRNTLGLKLCGLPIEEYLFYIVTSAYIILIWQTVNSTYLSDKIRLSLLTCTAIWSLAFIAIPYFLNIKGDKFK